MKQSIVRSALGILIAMLCALGSHMPAAAQSDEGPGDIMGVIPGTNMMKDEFRARARAQLTAVSINAHVHRMIYGVYPETLYDLYNSEAWNLDPMNMFTGEPIDAVMFSPDSSDMTTKPYLELSFNFVSSVDPMLDLSPSPLPGVEGGPPAPPTGGVATSVRTARVEPRAISDYSAGDIFYFVSDTLIQLIIWAPDGSYQEVVHEVPNPNWAEALEVNTGAPEWPQNLLLAQTAYYLERELPQAFNLVRFMGESDPMPQHMLTNASGEERLAMASAIGLTILNPLNKQPIEVSQQKSPGDIFEPNAENPVPIQLVAPDGKPISLVQLRQGVLPAGNTRQPAKGVQPGDTGKQAKPKEKDKTRKPPMGGKRT